jgi:hypothetical protein
MGLVAGHSRRWGGMCLEKIIKYSNTINKSGTNVRRACARVGWGEKTPTIGSETWRNVIFSIRKKRGWGAAPAFSIRGCGSHPHGPPTPIRRGSDTIGWRPHRRSPPPKGAPEP